MFQIWASFQQQNSFKIGQMILALPTHTIIHYKPKHWFGDTNSTRLYRDSGQIIGFKVGALRKALNQGAFVRMIPLWITHGLYRPYNMDHIAQFNIIDEEKSQDWKVFDQFCIDSNVKQLLKINSHWPNKHFLAKINCSTL